jgi:dTDP-glucose 4,6-dehydratase
MNEANPLAADLALILDRVDWEDLRGQRIFITGGTGFFGTWLIESFLWANARLHLGASATVLTRDAAGFANRSPHLAADDALTLVEGDVRTFAYPAGSFSHVIHAATPASAALNAQDPLTMLDTIVEGTRRVLDFSVACGARKLLLTSSGAVYGKQPAGMTHIPETYQGMPDTTNPASAYAEGKRMAELLCAIYHRRHGVETKIARCFAFTGPGLPLDAHFAAGNFVRDRLRGGPIRVNGDGTARRSYLYAADLMIWLWTILFRGDSCRPYNVGSDQDVSIAELAALASAIGGNVPVQIAKQPVAGAEPERYVPDVRRARVELGLGQIVSLAEGLRRTANRAAEKVTA